MISSIKRRLMAALCAALVVSAPATAQVVGTPGVPSGFGLAGNVVAFSLSGSYSDRRRAGSNATRFDASTAVVFGFGDPVDGIGFQLGANLTSFRKFGKSGFVTVGMHKMFQLSDAGIYSVALNVDNIAPWGDAKSNKLSGNIVASYMTGFGSQLGLVTVGVTNNTTPTRKLKPIFGISRGVTERSSVGFGHAGDSSTIGMTFAPAALQGASVSIAANHNWKTRQNGVTVDIGRAFALRGL
jgi:opacity protein-like surface antigen